MGVISIAPSMKRSALDQLVYSPLSSSSPQPLPPSTCQVWRDDAPHSIPVLPVSRAPAPPVSSTRTICPPGLGPFLNPFDKPCSECQPENRGPVERAASASSPEVVVVVVVIVVVIAIVRGLSRRCCRDEAHVFVLIRESEESSSVCARVQAQVSSSRALPSVLPSLHYSVRVHCV